MSKIIDFISVAKLKERTPINFNVEPQLVTMAIRTSQDIHIQTATGTSLYKKLKALIEDDSIEAAENEKYKTLLDDYIEDSLIQWALVESLKFIRMKIMNKSVSSENSDNSTPVDATELRILSQSIKNNAEWYSQRLIDFLKANESDYPEYSDNDDCDEIKPVNSEYFTGIELEDLPSSNAEYWERLSKQ